MRTDLADRVLHLARTLRDLMPDEPEVRGLLVLCLVTDARRATRTGADGRLLRLQEQDRSLWDRAALAEAHELIVAGLRGGRAGRYLLQAAIASLYAEAPTYEETDWPQIVALYDRLLSLWPSPAVALNRTVPVSMAQGPAAALAQVEALEQDGRLSRYQYLPAIKADLLAATRPYGRGGGRVPAGAGADRQRGRAGVPHRACHRSGDQPCVGNAWTARSTSPTPGTSPTATPSPTSSARGCSTCSWSPRARRRW
ncbi:DUF6596 domain-containing protein [Streptomyces sp. ALI-76-A]|uniref:DUF6596 domain-containing protein n=1 Tax=Streptomyces sp. ALI-76-A TaxID=3025736 RepID=UPI003365045A